MRLRHFILSLIVAAFCFLETARAERPNIVFILVDDMGYGDPGCYNPESKASTPNIDKLAADGMRFTDAHASGPLCHMSRYGLMTGRYPFRTDVNRWRTEPLIDEGQVTVASLLGHAGYETAMVGKWHCGFEERGKSEDYTGVLKGGPADRGFDSFFGIRASTDIPPYFYIDGVRAVMPPSDHIDARDSVAQGWTPIQGEFWREGGIAPDLKLPEVMPRFTEQAIEVIENNSDDGNPLMLYLAYPAPHTPWLPSEEFRGKSGAGMYGDFVMMVDEQIGRVLTALDAAGMSDDTLVMFSSDNGPVWYPEDIERFKHDAVGGLRGMKADAWEGGHRMPFVVRWPGKVQAGSVSGRLISFVDVMATLADVAGAEMPQEAGPDSFSFLPALTGEAAGDRAQRESLVLRSGRGVMTFRRGPWKYINDLGSGGFTKSKKGEAKLEGTKGQLYHLGDDRAESRNLWADKPELVAELKAEMNRIKGAGSSR